MQEQEIKPHKITKPIQLLSAWLVGLILINGIFIGAAISLETSNYLQDLLIFAAILNVPIFIISIFLLQTKYRPEMQEDLFYSKYLSQKTNKFVEFNRLDLISEKLESIQNQIDKKQTIQSVPPKSAKISKLKIQVNDLIPELIALRKFIKEKDYKIDGYFGKVDGNKVPDTWKIAISEDVDLELIKPLIKEMPKLGIEYYSLFDDIQEPTTAHLFIGAYGDINGKIDEEILKSIDEWDMVDFLHYTQMKKNK